MTQSFHVDRLQWFHPAYPVSRPPLKVLFLSDIHCPGPTARMRELASWLATRSSDEHARDSRDGDTRAWDVVLFGGDYQDGHGRVSDKVYEAILAVIRAARGRWGTFGVSGNHDHPTLVERLRHESSLRMLENEWYHLDGPVHVVGIGDAWQDRDDPRRAVSGIAAGSFLLGVAHSPDVAHKAAAAGVHALFCGHTHGGQVVLPLVGPPVRRLKRDRRLLSGEFRLNRMLLHVTMGFGASLFSIRYGTRSSICEVVIQHGALRQNRIRRVYPKGFWKGVRPPSSP